MKITELQKLIKEEVKKSLTEASMDKEIQKVKEGLDAMQAAFDDANWKELNKQLLRIKFFASILANMYR